MEQIYLSVPLNCNNYENIMIEVKDSEIEAKFVGYKVTHEC